MFGKLTEKDAVIQSNDESAIIHLISQCPPAQKEYAIRLLKLFISSMNDK